MLKIKHTQIAVKFFEDVPFELGFKGSHETGEEKFGLFLYQRLSMAVQRGNAASVLGSIMPSSSAAA